MTNLDRPGHLTYALTDYDHRSLDPVTGDYAEAEKALLDATKNSTTEGETMNFHPPTDGRWEMQPREFQIGQQVTLDDGNAWTVKAVTENFAALTRDVTEADCKAHREQYEEAHWDDDLADDYEELDDETFYTVLDWDNGYRGPCNLIGQGWGDGTYTEAECAAMLAEFESGELEISHRNWTRIKFADEVSA